MEVIEMQWEAEPEYWDRPTRGDTSPYWCDGKRRYESQAHAIENLVNCWGRSGSSDPSRSNTTYHCATCHGYHIGSMSVSGVSASRNWIRFRKGGKSHRRKTHRP